MGRRAASGASAVPGRLRPGLRRAPRSQGGPGHQPHAVRRLRGPGGAGRRLSPTRTAAGRGRGVGRASAVPSGSAVVGDGRGRGRLCDQHPQDGQRPGAGFRLPSPGRPCAATGAQGARGPARQYQPFGADLRRSGRLAAADGAARQGTDGRGAGARGVAAGGRRGDRRDACERPGRLLRRGACQGSRSADRHDRGRRARHVRVPGGGLAAPVPGHRRPAVRPSPDRGADHARGRRGDDGRTARGAEGSGGRRARAAPGPGGGGALAGRVPPRTGAAATGRVLRAHRGPVSYTHL